jgi:hypothetical protein
MAKGFFTEAERDPTDWRARDPVVRVNQAALVELLRTRHDGELTSSEQSRGVEGAATTVVGLIGDDRLQKRAIGFTSPEKYTHSTSTQRVRWFRLGLQTGDNSTRTLVA